MLSKPQTLLRRIPKTATRQIITTTANRTSSHCVSHNVTHRNFSTHEFKAETKKLLDIVAKSLYTDPEVFVRELVSNASDSLEKLRFATTGGIVKNLADKETPLHITLAVDKEAGTFTITDTGIGMTKDELIQNLGTIAKSGSKDFETDGVIGQFGVGFYSTFVVADKVTVYSKHADSSDKGNVWTSEGLGHFDVSEYDGSVSLPRGTSIVCHLKPEALSFADEEMIRKVAVKFSNFVDFPIRMEKRSMVEKPKEETSDGEKKDGEDLAEKLSETPPLEEQVTIEELNKTEALWLKKNPREQEHLDFFRYLNGTSYGDPLYSWVFHTDAPLSIKSIFYVPEDAPNRMFANAQTMQIGVALHSKRVLVNKHADKIIPQWLHWIKGVVDCDDLPLNISRESMQDSALMKKLSHSIVRRILKFMSDEARRNVDNYDKFYSKYSFYLKAGLLEDSQSNGGAHKDFIKKLLKFNVVNLPEEITNTIEDADEKEKIEKLLDRSTVSFDEYIKILENTKSNVDKCRHIFYLHAGDNIDAAKNSPFMEQFAKNKVPVLVLTEDIDEFVVSYLSDNNGFKLTSIDSEELKDVEHLFDNATDSDSTSKNRLTSEQQTSLEARIKQTLGSRVQQVKFSDRLSSSPAIVTSQMNAHMRRMMKNMMAASGNGGGMGDDFMPMNLELNPSHQTVLNLAKISEEGSNVPDVVIDSAINLLFDNSAISAGLIEDPRKLLGRLNGVLEMCLDRELGLKSETVGTSDEGVTVEEIKKE